MDSAMVSGVATDFNGTVDSRLLLAASNISSPRPAFNHSPSINPGQIALTLIGPKFLAIEIVIVFKAPFEAA
jgi:hypothetical protein